jgi:hypothetical protein
LTQQFDSQAFWRIDGNAIIAIWMGESHVVPYCKYNIPKYDQDWNKLISAIKKFRSLKLDSEKWMAWCQAIDNALTESYDIKYAHGALVEAIQKYNT